LKHGQKHKRIHSFDLFQLEDYSKKSYFADRADLRTGDSTYEMYLRNTRGFRDLVQTYPGDIRAVKWCGKSIEICFVDVMKTAEIHDAVVEQFFPSLIP